MNHLLYDAKCEAFTRCGRFPELVFVYLMAMFMLYGKMVLSLEAH